jgi:hypothetical protein
MEKWISLGDIALLLERTKSTIIRKAQREKWAYRMVDGNGGKQKRFHLADLPEVKARLGRRGS